MSATQSACWPSKRGDVAVLIGGSARPFFPAGSGGFAIFLLAQADTVLTVLMLETGEFVEANPLMQLLIDQDIYWFVNVRSLLWGVLLVALVAVASRLQVWRIRPRRIIHGVAVVYLAQTAGMFTMLMATG